ncbi:MAG: DUF4153 domain-containing protein [Herbinix sp.]|nr:DUF4153 domain-containing protein [Herbinix sp.]
MKQFTNLRDRWKGFLDTLTRFPLTIILLTASVITNAIAINTQEDEIYIRLFITFVLGASIYTVCQLLYERYFDNLLVRFAFAGVTIIISIVYYLLINNTHWGAVVTTRTIVIFFILLIGFLWVPVIKSKINFNQSFTAAFKAFFITVFFTGILFLGTVLIVRAIDTLIVRVNERAYGHAANIIFVLLAPIYFLTLIPLYPKKVEEQASSEKIDNRLISPTKLLETLVSFIIIPITAVFTIILLLYIVMNITGAFWTDNLMEPLLLSYSITVIIVYLLANNMKSAFSKYFRMIFPKVLVPVVLFQTLSSILRIGNIGVTYGRYYVILFGVFATVAGFLFCILPVRKNGIIAPILIALSVISIVPPIDAFTVSKVNQIGRLENALKRNNMLEGKTIIPKTNVSIEDQEIILSSVRYLDSMEYSKDIIWLTAYTEAYNFNNTFGFSQSEIDKNNYLNVYITRNESTPIPITGYDYLIFKNISDQSGNIKISDFIYKDKSYTLRTDASLNNQVILLEEDNQELIRLDMNEIYNKFSNTVDTKSVGTEEVTFTKENSSAILTVIAQTININEWEGGKDQYADVYIMVYIK